VESIDTIMVTLIEELLPSAAQFVMVLIALVGTIIVLWAFMDLYRMMSEDEMRTPEGATVSGSLVRIVIGGLMVVPAAVLWRAADLFLDGATATETSVLSYIAGTMPTGTCERFGTAIQLMFLVVGLIALYFAYRNADDQARGFNPNGYRTAVPYAIGGLGCIFIEDIFVILGNTFDLDIGLTQLCAAFA
jgi:hypothetical protein